MLSSLPPDMLSCDLRMKNYIEVALATKKEIRKQLEPILRKTSTNSQRGMIKRKEKGR